jgi:flagellar biosynthetic protein FlhB
MFVSLLKYLGGTLLVLGIFDWFFRHRQHINDLKMTKQEVKQENKDAQGDMEAKARIRGRQKQFAMKRMMAEVPKATVVVVNPTHFAVALRYESSMAAPVVVAKGRDHVALRIKAVAKENGVPVIENPPLARALHESARIGDEIPPTLYKAVAEMLAMIFRTDKRLARGERRVERRPA